MESRLDHFVCYACDAKFSKLPGEADDIVCPSCTSEFVEKLEDEEVPSNETTQQSSQPVTTKPKADNSNSKTAGPEAAGGHEVDSQGNEFQSCDGSDPGLQTNQGVATTAKREERKQSEIEKQEESKGEEMAEEDEWEDDGDEEEYYEEEGPQTQKNKKKQRQAQGQGNQRQYGQNVRTNTYRVNQGQNNETIVHQIDLNFDENNQDISQQDMSSLQSQINQLITGSVPDLEFAGNPRQGRSRRAATRQQQGQTNRPLLQNLQANIIQVEIQHHEDVIDEFGHPMEPPRNMNISEMEREDDKVVDKGNGADADEGWEDEGEDDEKEQEKNEEGSGGNTNANSAKANAPGSHANTQPQNSRNAAPPRRPAGASRTGAQRRNRLLARAWREEDERHYQQQQQDQFGNNPNPLNDLLSNIIGGGPVQASANLNAPGSSGGIAQQQQNQPASASTSNAQGASQPNFQNPNHPNLISLNPNENMDDVDPLIGPQNSGQQQQQPPRSSGPNPANPLSNIFTQVLNISNNININNNPDGGAQGQQQNQQQSAQSNSSGYQSSQPLFFQGPGYAGGMVNLNFGPGPGGAPAGGAAAGNAAGGNQVPPNFMGGPFGGGGLLSNILNMANGPDMQMQNQQLNQALQQSFTDFMNQANGTQGRPASEKFMGKLKVIKGSDIVESKDCQICMEKFQDEDKIHKLPCKHLFHKDCIDPWFKGHDTCPVCRQVMPHE